MSVAADRLVITDFSNQKAGITSFLTNQPETVFHTQGHSLIPPAGD